MIQGSYRRPINGHSNSGLGSNPAPWMNKNNNNFFWNMYTPLPDYVVSHSRIQ
jgi:hypothetical protein